GGAADAVVRRGGPGRGRPGAPFHVPWPILYCTNRNLTMAISVVMPALEMAQENGKLLAWRKKEGERVIKGEPLLEIETDKAVVEVEAPGDGILAGITADVGAVIPVGQTIAWLVAPGDKRPAMAVTAARV